MTEWEAFEFVCGRLRAEFLGIAPAPPLTEPSWNFLIAASSSHYVTPAFAWAIRHEAQVPDEVRDFFEATIALNARRNEALLNSLERVVAALNGVGIEPVPLKGAAMLVTELFPDPGLRLMADLDVLIPQEQSATAVDALRRVGFDDAELHTGPEHHHLPPLKDGETGPRLELHTRLSTAADVIVPVGWFMQTAQARSYRGLQIRMPDATRLAAHNIVHHQLDSGGYRRQRIELRQLLDFARLRALHEHELDLGELDRRFCDAGQGAVFATYLGFAQTLLGQLAPPLREKPRPNAVGIIRRSVERPGWRAWMTLVDFARQVREAFRRQPSVALQLLDPRRLPERLRKLARAFRKRKW